MCTRLRMPATWSQRLLAGPDGLSSEDQQLRTVRRRGKARFSLAVYLARSPKAVEIASFDD
jgi:hypothetical protein